jgi:hypothetical protein
MNVNEATGMRLFDVTVSPYLTGSKNAVLRRNTLCVSPAMFDLMTHADQKELEKLLASIGVVDLRECKTTLICIPKG